MSVNRLQELTKKVTNKLLAILETTVTVTGLVKIFIYVEIVSKTSVNNNKSE
jgi:hypothetical protein